MEGDYVNSINYPVAVVTGGNSGIGKAIARALSKNGAPVAIVGRNQDRLREVAAELGGSSTWHCADVSDRRQVAAAVSGIIERHSRIDVLVNCAGLLNSVTTGDPLDLAEMVWDEVLDINLKGSFLMACACSPYLPRPGGRIINISSIGAQTGGSGPGGLAYAAAKAGVVGLTFSLARELSPQGITANVISPGYIANTNLFGGDLPEERMSATVSQIPAGRVGQPEDVAAAVLYLASPEASYVTGQILNVNGGWLFGP